MTSRRLTSASPNRHTLRFRPPLSVTCYPPQKLCVMEVTKLTLPACPSCENSSPPPSPDLSRVEACPGTRLRRAAPRRSSPCSSPIGSRRKACIDETNVDQSGFGQGDEVEARGSLTPRITATFTFTGSYPSSAARSMDFMTRSWPLRRVRSSNLAGTSVSREMFTCVRPTALSASSACAGRVRLW